IHRLVQLAVERTSHAGIESQKSAEHRGTVRHRFLNAARLAFQLAIIDFPNFRAGLRRLNQTNAGHVSSPMPLYNKRREFFTHSKCQPFVPPLSPTPRCSDTAPRSLPTTRNSP